MTHSGDILLVADLVPSDEFADHVRSGRLVRIPDPYDALMEMERRHWPTVLLTAPRPDFAGLCRASRRLQPVSALFGLCPPAAEPEVRPLAGKVLTDYFICPPSRRDVDRILRAASAAQVSTAAGRGAAELSPEVFSELLGAANSVSSLESCLSQLVGRHIGCAVSWTDARELRAGLEPLLLSAEDPPRALVSARPLASLPPESQGFISALRRCLPALLGTAQRAESLHRMAITDPLTGAYNRRYFYHLTDQILLRAVRKESRVTLLLYDIDDFKRYNDTYGYAAGDEILRDAAALMKRITRKHDVVARIGGDEFAVLFWDFQRPRQPDSRPPESAYVLADRFRQSISRHEFPSLGPEAVGILTISGGLARFPGDGRTCRELLRSADQALKQVKRSGKDGIKLVGRE